MKTTINRIRDQFIKAKTDLKFAKAFLIIMEAWHRRGEYEFVDFKSNGFSERVKLFHRDEPGNGFKNRLIHRLPESTLSLTGEDLRSYVINPACILTSDCHHDRDNVCHPSNISQLQGALAFVESHWDDCRELAIEMCEGSGHHLYTSWNNSLSAITEIK